MLEGESFPHAATALIAKRLLNRHSPGEIAEAITVLIDVLDLMEPDPDAETGNDLEDDFSLSPMALQYAPNGAGCFIADQDAGSYVEWHTMRGRQKGGQCQLAGEEDDEQDDEPEEDDHSGQCDEDGINTAYEALRYQYGSSGPGCVISDDDYTDDDTEPNGDEKDSANAEDEVLAFSHFDLARGPGCEISDPGGCQHDGRELDDGY